MRWLQLITTAVRSPRGSATDPRRPSIRPRDTAAAAASLAVSARTSDFQTLRYGVSLYAWYRPRIFLGGLQARVWDLSSLATAFGLQYRRCGSCHTVKKSSEATQTLRANCSKADPQTNKQTDRGDYNTLRSLARHVIGHRYRYRYTCYRRSILGLLQRASLKTIHQ